MTSEDLLSAESFDLPAVFAALRLGFERAQAQLLAGDAAPIMLLDSAEIELEVLVEKDTKGGGGVNLKVIGVGVEGGVERNVHHGRTHRLKVSLRPAGDTGLLGGSQRR
jgi:hypothetical protein